MKWNKSSKSCNIVLIYVRIYNLQCMTRFWNNAQSHNIRNPNNLSPGHSNGQYA